ncbi:hypothetical protein KC19_VG282100 [Ceratodon purpureus]|uniref:Uncharacterized protein n=1 Tax=Ceratodon purpureus TaxID=3225 RepID=A0A8T0HUE8_CERPU|nr:hypothetical protein KC19_VG282100 [Ceratodon purpureus]
MAHPVGAFWRHMKNFSFERAAYTVPWHLDWSQHDTLTKLKIKLRLKKLYSGDWNDSYDMQMVGNNIWERRVRLRRSFARAQHKNLVPIGGGVTLDSWNAIFNSLSNPEYLSKSVKCKVAADERSRKRGFTHKLGRRGVQGLVSVFMSEFERQPTNEEMIFAKQNGIPAAVEKVRHNSSEDKIQEAVEVGKVIAHGLKQKGKKKT